MIVLTKDAFVLHMDIDIYQRNPPNPNVLQHRHAATATAKINFHY